MALLRLAAWDRPRRQRLAHWAESGKLLMAYGVADASPGGKLPNELCLFLDELANVLPIEDLPSLASQGAGRGVLLMSIVQHLSQLRSRYGMDRANSTLNHHPCKLILPGVSDPETVDLLGRHAVTDVQVSRGGDGRLSRSYALRQLESSCAVALHRGRPPIILHLRPWYRSRRYLSPQLTRLVPPAGP